MRSSKSYSAWILVRQWCLDNPRKKAAVIAPNGTFEVVFVPKDASNTTTWAELADMPSHDWLKKRFLE